MFEQRSERLVPRLAFYRRLARSAGLASLIILGSLVIGVIGYRVLEGLPWIDALLNASMILGSMGPVDPLHSAAGKIFASAYALYSGLVFVLAAGILVAPAVHRLLHRFHLEQADEPTA